MKKVLNQFPFIRSFLLGLRHKVWSGKTVKALNSYLPGNNSPKLHLGAGKNLLPGWFNTDYFPRENIFFINVTKPFLIPSNTFHFIFTEHHIEHIAYKDAVLMLKEAYRILKPGGMIRIDTPDLKSYLAAYFNGGLATDDFTKHSKDFIYSGFYNAVNYVPVDEYFAAHEINDIFMNYEHKFIYDFESLKRISTHAGFANIKDCSQQNSTHPEFQNIASHNSDFEKRYTLTVEAEKV